MDDVLTYFKEDLTLNWCKNGYAFEEMAFFDLDQSSRQHIGCGHEHKEMSSPYSE